MDGRRTAPREGAGNRIRLTGQLVRPAAGTARRGVHGHDHLAAPKRGPPWWKRGVRGGLVSVLNPETRLSLVAVDDIGRAAAAAVLAPQRFHGVELALASDHLPMTEIAAVLSRVLGIPLSAPDMTEEQAIAAGMPAMGASHERLNVAGRPGRPRYAKDLGIPLTSFEEWAREHLSGEYAVR